MPPAPPPPRRRVPRVLSWLGRGLAVLFTLGFAGWGALALDVQAAGAPWVRWGLVPVWVGLSLGAALAWAGALPPRWQRPWRWLWLLALLALLLWWGTLRPSHDRLWADDVARLPHAVVEGNLVRITNVRNFTWRTETDYTPQWETRTYNLDQLTDADLILSYWMGPHIAHTLVSFGFADGERVVFSLEIRKERHEAFSAVGGFFRQFEQVLVVADETDIVRTRSNARGETVYLYRLQASPELLRQLFLDYVEAMQEIERAPQFYNTLTSNCTTVVFDLARLSTPGLPFDYRLLASGHVAEYVYDLNGLTPGYDYATLQERGFINERALATPASGEGFSAAIREGVPGVGAAP